MTSQYQLMRGSHIDLTSLLQMRDSTSCTTLPAMPRYAQLKRSPAARAGEIPPPALAGPSRSFHDF
jgi:hypothetical protein